MTDPILWTVDGVDLQTEAWGVADWGGSTEAPPSLRGGAVTVPYRPGQVWSPGVPEQRTLTLDMWVTDQDPDTGERLGEQQLLDNWTFLRSLFWGFGEREITKTWDVSYGSATGRATFAGGLEPSNFALTGAKFSVSLLMADPYFYGPEVNLGTYAVGTHDITDEVLGDAMTPRYSLRFVGPLNVPGVTVRRGDEVLSTVTLRAGLAAGQEWTVTLPDATYSGLASVTPADVAATRAAWVAVDPSATSLVVSGTGAGAVVVDYEPAYL